MRHSVAAFALATLALAACGGGSDDGESTRTTAASTTSVAPTTTIVATTISAPPACEGQPKGSGSSEVVERSADVDGDGADDLVRTELTDPASDQWLLTVELAAGGGAHTEIPGDGVAAVTIVGGYDLGGDGADELWVRVGAGASATIFGIFRLDACDLERITLESGDPVELPVGGSIGSSAGVGCDTEEGADVTSYFASLLPDEPVQPSYELSHDQYRLDGSVLVKIATVGPSEPVAEPDFEVYASFRCGDLSL